MTNRPKEMVDREDFKVWCPLGIRYADIDMQQVVYNSHYLVYYDEAIMMYLKNCGYGYTDEAEATGKDFQLVQVNVTYRQPLRYTDELWIGVRIARLGSSSITWSLAIFRNDEAEPASTGEIVWVYVEMAKGKSTPIPEALRSRLLNPAASA
ncbi:MAG: thioesterase family protein [SAR324 cluster bacterium]|jgi:acyl-CoA thioester hydrolase|nr:thioesterase family protein [SAR324 cluster bacterium]